MLKTDANPFIWFSSVQLLSRVWFFMTPWTTALQASLSITNSWSLLKQMFIVPVMPSNHLILCCSLLFLSLIFPNISLFKWVSSLHQVAKILEFQLQNQSFWWTTGTNFSSDGLVGSPSVQGTLKSLLQHHSSKASILLHSAFFIVQLSQSYMTTGKKHSLD